MPDLSKLNMGSQFAGLKNLNQRVNDRLTVPTTTINNGQVRVFSKTIPFAIETNVINVLIRVPDGRFGYSTWELIAGSVRKQEFNLALEYYFTVRTDSDGITLEVLVANNGMGNGYQFSVDVDIRASLYQPPFN